MNVRGHIRMRPIAFLSAMLLGAWVVSSFRQGAATMAAVDGLARGTASSSERRAPQPASNGHDPGGAGSAAPPGAALPATFQRSASATKEAADDATNGDDHSPEQREWRIAWARQSQDDQWTGELLQELHDRAERLAGQLLIKHLSCRETICRAYLQFADQIDAAEFRAMSHDPAHQYDYQSLDPNFDGVGFDDSDSTFELLIRRPRPAHLHESSLSEPPAFAFADAAAP